MILVRSCRAQSRQSAKLFLKLSELGLPQPLARRRVSPPPTGSGGRSTLDGERGWESPNSYEGTYTVVLFIYTYFVLQRYLHKIQTLLPGAKVFRRAVQDCAHSLNYLH
jgi:hypothetical protein